MKHARAKKTLDKNKMILYYMQEITKKEPPRIGAAFREDNIMSTNGRSVIFSLKNSKSATFAAGLPHSRKGGQRGKIEQNPADDRKKKQQSLLGEE